MNNTSNEKLPSSIVDAQLQRLLEIVNEFERHQCEELLDQAKTQASQIVRHSYKNARNRLRTNIMEDRQQLEQSLASVRAKRHTFIMQQKHQASRIFLDKAWEQLTAKLKQRWKDKNHRGIWLKSIIDVAIKTLPASEWVVEHAENWPEEEHKQLVKDVEELTQKQITFQESSQIEAGIRISGTGAVVDGTLEGLLNDRVRIESEILAQCTHCIVHGTANAEE